MQVACKNSYKMIAIKLNYLYNISGVTVLHHKRRTVHSIYQISTSQNTNSWIRPVFPDLVTLTTILKAYSQTSHIRTSNIWAPLSTGRV